jgi:hypothetical protein
MAPEGCARRFCSSDKTNLAGDIDGLGPARHTELAHDITDVELHRRLRDVQPLPDRDVAEPASEEPEDLAFAWGHLLNGMIKPMPVVQRMNNRTRAVRVEGAVTPMHGPNGAHQLVGLDVLRQVAFRALLDRLEYEPLLDERRQYEDSAVRYYIRSSAGRGSPRRR